jgi:hypothetical protein
VQGRQVNTQLGRRNITAEQKSYLRGKRYLEERKEVGSQEGNQKAAKNENKGVTLTPLFSESKTASKVAKDLDVSESTIHRDAAFAEAVDAIADKAGDEGREAALSGKMTKKEVLTVAKKKSPAKVQASIAKVKDRKKKVRGPKKKPAPDMNGTPQEREPGDDTESEEAATDEGGNIIPEQALAAFALRPDFRKFSRVAGELIAEVDRLAKSPAGLFIHYQSISQKLIEAKNAMWGAKPAYVCPYCEGTRKNCTVCKGHGWTDKNTAQQSVRKIKA